VFFVPFLATVSKGLLICFRLAYYIAAAALIAAFTIAGAAITILSVKVAFIRKFVYGYKAKSKFTDSETTPSLFSNSQSDGPIFSNIHTFFVFVKSNEPSRENDQ